MRKRPQREDWPPYQPTSIVNVAVIHYKTKLTQQKLIEISEHFTASGDGELVTSPTSQTKVTKDINEIFKLDPADQGEGDSQSQPPKLILIEGAPGIGKTVLAKQIAYLWADNKILTDCKLVILVYLRDPRVHAIKSAEELLHLYSTTKEEATEVNAYLEKTRGQGVAFIFDGFDEFPVSEEDSIVTDIIGIDENYSRKFCKSIVVVTSRPIATLFLRTLFDRKVEILGFPLEERNKLIALSGVQCPDRKAELEKYFKQHPIINSLCCIPLNLSIILYLFHHGNLPETLTEMNESFVIHTVYRHMKKTMSSPIAGCINHLEEMPEHILKIIHNLSILALVGLLKKQLVFTYSDIEKICPEICDVPEAANGFSLLQAVEYHSHKGVGKTTSFNFLHLTMQEYLGAYCVSLLPEEEQLELLRTKFWDGHFSFMWIMYVGTVGIKSGPFANFIKTNILNMLYYIEKVKCLHLFQCYMEAKIDTEIPLQVTSIFSDGDISLSGMTLLSHHVTSLLFFMNACVQQWKSLKLSNCFLQRVEMYNIMQNMLNNKERMSTLEHVDLSLNVSSPWGVYCAVIRHSCVSSLTLCGDKGMTEYIKEITDSLQVNTTLQSLTLFSVGKVGVESIKEVLTNNLILTSLNLSWEKYDNKNSETGRIHTLILPTKDSAMETREIAVNVMLYNNPLCCRPFHKLKNTCTEILESTNINLNSKNIRDNAAHVLAFALCNNTTVVGLNISNNYITDEGAAAIISCLKHNRILKRLTLSQNRISIKGMNKMLESIETQGIALSLEYVDLAKNKSSPWNMYCAIIRHCCSNNLTLCGDEGIKDCVQEIFESLQENTTLHSLELCNIESCNLMFFVNSLKYFHLSQIKDKSKKVFYLSPDMYKSQSPYGRCKIIINFDVSYDECSPKTIDLPKFNINNDDIIRFIEGYTTIKRLNFSHNNITGDGPGAGAICNCLKHNKTLKEVDLSYNYICVSGMKKIAENIEILGATLSLEYVDISKNGSSPWGVYCAIIRHSCVSSLTLCGDEGMNEYIKEIADSLEANATLQSIALLGVGKIGVESIKPVLMNVLTLKSLKLSWKKIKSVECILTHTSFSLHSDDAIQTKATQNNTNRIVSVRIIYGDNVNCSHLSPLSSDIAYVQSYESKPVLTLSGIKINDDAVHVLAFGLCYNTTVEDLNVSYNDITDEGAIAITDCLKYNKTLKKLDLSYNKIGINGMNRIIESIKSQGTTLPLEYVDLSKNRSSPWGVYCAIIRYHCVHSLTLCGDEGMKEYVKEITDSLQANATLQSLTILFIGKIGVESIKKILMNDVSLKTLKLSCETSNMYNKHVKMKKTRAKLMHTPNTKTGDTAPTAVTVLITNIVVNVSISYSNDFNHTQPFSLSSDIVCTQSCESKAIINLSSKWINDDGAYVLAYGLCYNTTVQELNVSHNMITDDGAVAIIDCLKHNKMLKKLDLSFNRINTYSKTSKLLEYIESQKTTLSLNYVDLSINLCRKGAKQSSRLWGVYCAIIRHCCVNILTLSGDEGMKEYVEEISDSLQANTTLQSLTLLSIGRIGVESIKAVLMGNLTLKNLNLSWSKINTSCAKKILMHTLLSPTANTEDVTQAVNDTNRIVNFSIFYDDDVGPSQLLPLSSSNICIQDCELKSVINLSGRKINNNAIYVLAFGLCSNTIVEELNISHNEITDDGAIAIIECLKHNKTLKGLDVSYNRISKSGMYKMLETIKDQKMVLLKYVDLSNNGSSPWGVYCAIIRHCCANSLTLCGDEGMKEHVTEISDNLQVNMTLHSLTLVLCNIGENELQLLMTAISSLNKPSIKNKTGKLRKFTLNVTSSSGNTASVNISVSFTDCEHLSSI